MHIHRRIISAAATLALGLSLTSCSMHEAVNIYYPFQSEEDSNWGLIGTDGEVLFADEFSAKSDLSLALNDRFYVKQDGDEWQLYKAGKKPEPVGEKYVDFSLFNTDVAVVTKKSACCQIIDREGATVAVLDKIGDKAVRMVGGFSDDGFAPVMVGSSDEPYYGIINTQGKVTVEPQYCQMRMDRYGNFAVVDNKYRNADRDKLVYHIIDGKGKEKFTFSLSKYKDGFFGDEVMIDGYMPYAQEDRGWGLLDDRGKVALKASAKIQRIGELRDGLFTYYDGENWGVKDLKGETVVRPKYEHLFFATDKLLWAKSVGKDYRLVNLKGETVSTDEYKWAHPFADGDNGYVQVTKHDYRLVGEDGKEQELATEIANISVTSYIPFWVSSDYLDVDALVAACHITGDGLGAFKFSMSPAELINAYRSKNPADDHGDVTPANWTSVDRLAYTTRLDDVEFDIDCYYKRGYMGRSGFNPWTWEYDYRWTDEPLSYIRVNIKGDAVQGKTDLIYEALRSKLETLGSIYSDGDYAAVYRISDERGVVLSRQRDNVSLKIVNSDDFTTVDVNSFRYTDNDAER